MRKSDWPKSCEDGHGAPVGKTSSDFQETPTEFLIKCKVHGRRKGKWKYETLNKSVLMVQMDRT